MNFSSNVLGQFDPTAEVTTAAATMGTVFGIIFTAVLGVKLGKIAISWIRS